MGIAKELRRYLQLLWTWAWLILLGAALAGGVNYYLSSKAPARYEANTTLMVGQFVRQANPDQMEVGIADRLAGYYLELLRRQPVLEGVKKQLNLNIPNEQLAGMVAARVVPATAFIEISVVDIDPIRVVKLVNTFAAELIKQSPTAPENQRKEQRDFLQNQLDDLQAKIENGRKSLQSLNDELNKGTTAAEIADTRAKIKALETQIDGWQTNYTNLLRLGNTSSPNSITILEESNQSRRVKSLSPLISAGIAAAIGAVLAFVCAIVLEYLDDRIKTPSDLQSRLKLLVLGHIKSLNKKKAQTTTSNGAEVPFDQDAVQAYELLCTNIIFSDAFNGQRKSIMLTTTEKILEQPNIALNLAISMVSFEQEVLLVDADVHNPQLHELLGLKNQLGFHETFYGNGFVNLEDVVQETAVPNLYLISAGDNSPQSQRITAVRPGTQQIYSLPHGTLPGNFVIFNCGSILSDKTTRLLASHVTGTILVCRLNHTRKQEIKAAIEVVERLKGQVLGVITIDTPRRFLPRLPKPTRQKSKKSEMPDAASVA